MYFQFQYSQLENPLHVLSIPIQPIRKPFTCTFNSNAANQKTLYMYFQFQYSQSENPLHVLSIPIKPIRKPFEYSALCNRL